MLVAAHAQLVQAAAGLLCLQLLELLHVAAAAAAPAHPLVSAAAAAAEGPVGSNNIPQNCYQSCHRHIAIVPHPLGAESREQSLAPYDTST